MSIAEGPRPWTVNLFAAIFLITGLLRLTAQLHGLPHWSELEANALGAIDWTREREIILAFTVMTIICIPVLAIWGFASRIARTLVAAFSAPGLLFGWASAMVDEKSYATALLAESILCLTVIALLFTPATSRWLCTNKEKRVAAAR
ncbi:MAG: hypothetical protein AAF697_04630 [Pseudomonadota bacterium]